MRITKEISGNMDSKKIKYFVSNSKSIQCILKRVLENRVISTVTSWSIVSFRNIDSVNIYTAKQKNTKIVIILKNVIMEKILKLIKLFIQSKVQITN